MLKLTPFLANKSAVTYQPNSQLEDKIYALSNDITFTAQIKHEQDTDPVISAVKRLLLNGDHITQGRLKRVQKQLRVRCTNVTTPLCS